jgi:hypothetical protein
MVDRDDNDREGSGPAPEPENVVWDLAERLWARHQAYLEDVIAKAPPPDLTIIGRIRRMVRGDDEQEAA